jgi:phosphatidylglycerol---prolipoprotein diacylglyceryl transferase
MHQILYKIPLHFGWFPDGIPIYGFGMMLFLAFMACTWLASRRGARVGISSDTIADVAIWLFVGGILGARIVYLVTVEHVQDVSELVSRLYRIWDGGIVLYGALVGGALAYLLGYWISFRKRGLDSLQLADVIAPCLALGIGLGRLGCFLNGCCYGQPACPDCATYAIHFPLAAPARYDLVDAGYQTAAGFTFDQIGSNRVGVVDPSSPAWKAGVRPGDHILKINGQDVEYQWQASAFLASPASWKRGEAQLRLEVEHEQGNTQELEFTPYTIGLYPTQLFETISMLLLVLLLLAFSPFKTHDGQVMALFMICYAVHRYLNELLRNDPRPVGFERYGSVLLLAGGVALFLYLWYRRPAQYQPRFVV